MAQERDAKIILVMKLGPSNTRFRLNLENGSGSLKDPVFWKLVHNFKRWHKLDNPKRHLGVLIEDPFAPATSDGLQYGHYWFDLRGDSLKAEKELAILSNPFTRIPFKLRKAVRQAPGWFEEQKLKFYLALGHALYSRES